MSLVRELQVFFTSGNYYFQTELLALFKILFGASLLLKYAVELGRNFPNHVRKGSFLQYTFLSRSAVKSFLGKVYVVSFHLRPLLAVAFIIAPYTRITALVMLASYYSELHCLFRYHCTIICLVLGIVMIDPVFDRVSILYDASGGNIVSAPSVLFIKATIILVYLSSALRKYQNQFYTGILLREAARFSNKAQKRKSRDHFHDITRRVSEKLIASSRFNIAPLVIFFQVLIAAFLCMPPPVSHTGMALAIVLHIGITLLFPMTFSFFTLMMISFLLLWL